MAKEIASISNAAKASALALRKFSKLEHEARAIDERETKRRSIQILASRETTRAIIVANGMTVEVQDGDFAVRIDGE